MKSNEIKKYWRIVTFGMRTLFISDDRQELVEELDRQRKNGKYTWRIEECPADLARCFGL